MKLPRFLFEEEDIKLLESKSGAIKKTPTWVYLDKQAESDLIKHLEVRPASDSGGLTTIFLLEMTDRVIRLVENAHTVADYAAAYGLIIQLGSYRQDLPRRLLGMLPKPVLKNNEKSHSA